MPVTKSSGGNSLVKLSRLLKDYKETGAVNEVVNLYGFVDEHTFHTKSGDLGVVVKLAGVDYECLDPAQMDELARRFEAAMRTFDEKFRVYQYLVKRDEAPLPHRDDYSDPVVREAVANRIAHLRTERGQLFEVSIYFVILYEAGSRKRSLQGRAAEITRNPLALLGALSTRQRIEVIGEEIDRGRAALSNKVNSFLIQLREHVGVDLLDKGAAFQFFRMLLNFTQDKANRIRLKHDAFLDYFVCDSAIECHRDHLRVDDYFIKVLTMKEPPSQTAANLLHQLLEIPCNCVAVTEWQRQDNFAMRKLIQSKRRHHHNAKSSLMNYVNFSEQSTTPDQMLVDDSASALVHDLGSCLKEMEVNGNYFGQFSFTIVLYDRRKEHVDRASAEAFKVFSTVDSVLLEERYNLLNAFLATLPGNVRYNLRYLYLLNTNYADLSFLFTSHRGEVWNHHLGEEYLAILETTQSNPFFLNLHYQDVAHTIILGRTGSGKSFFLNFLLTNLQKYRPFTFIFDLGGSYEHLTRLFGGGYLKIGIERRSFTINPCRLENTKENLQFLFSFVKVLIESGGYQMNSQDDREVYAAVCNIYDKLGGNPDAERRRKHFWLWGRYTPALFRALKPLDSVLAISRVGNAFGFAIIPARVVPSERTVVFVGHANALFPVLQSRVHETWARFFSATLKDDLMYAPSDCFETFPFPAAFEANDQLQRAGEAYYLFRADLMVRNNEGLTKTYNRFHRPDERSADIQRLRELHALMDRAVLDAYGWTDIPGACDFFPEFEEDEDEEADTGRVRQKKYRYRWPDEVHDEVLARLLALNKERAGATSEIPAAGPPARKAKRPKSLGKESEPTLFR